MLEELGISKETFEFINQEEKKVKKEFAEIDTNCDLNTLKVLSAFHKFNVSENCFNSTTRRYNAFNKWFTI